MKTLNVACVGGWHVHYKHFSEKIVKIPGCHLVAVWDDDLERGKAWADDMGCKFEPDYDKILEDTGIDAVIISVGTVQHAKMIVPAAKVGKHIYVEKALASTNEDAYAIQEAVHAAEEKYGIHFTMADPVKRNSLVFAKQMADEGKLGTLTNVRMRNLHSGALEGTALPRFYDKKQAGGGALIDMGCHCIHVLHWFLGKAISAYALFDEYTPEAKENGIDENTIAIYKFESGAIGAVETGWIHPGYQYAVDVYGTKGCVHINHNEVRYHLDEGDWATVPQDELPEGVLYPLNYWVNSIFNDTPNEEYGIDEAVVLTEMITAAYRAKGKEMPV